MNPFIRFMVAPAGRVTRLLAGIALIAWGWFGLNGPLGIVVMVVGVVPLLAGLFDFCVFAPLFGNPLGGADIRKKL